jgi:hypothetical protein
MFQLVGHQFSGERLIDKILLFDGSEYREAVFACQGIFSREVTGYRLKGSMLVTIGVLLSTGSRPQIVIPAF